MVGYGLAGLLFVVMACYWFSIAHVALGFLFLALAVVYFASVVTGGGKNKKKPPNQK